MSQKNNHTIEIPYEVQLILRDSFGEQIDLSQFPGTMQSIQELLEKSKFVSIQEMLGHLYIGMLFEYEPDD